MITGEEIACPASSSKFAFASAIVFNETVWVFASAWDRAQSSQPNCKPWGCGACANGSCYVAAWNSSDLVTWDGPFVALQLPPNVTVPNVGVSVVSPPSPPVVWPPPGLPVHQAFMALEARTPGASGNLIALNTRSDGDLSRGWQLLNASTHAIGGPNVNSAGSCPSARFRAADGYYYVIGGGADVDITRSANLSIGSWEAPSPPFMERGCAFNEENCAPGTNVARVAPGFYSNYWLNGSDHGERAFLSNLSSWQYSVNDADFCDADGVTYFIYGMCCQTKPANFTGKCGNFYALGTANASLVDWLASYFA